MASFVALAITAAATIGMGNVITTFYALHLGATSFQVGLIYGAQSFGMMLMTMPAGFIIARYGARRVYLLSSIMVMAAYVAVPWLKLWYLLASARAVIGLCAPFRTVSMNSSFLQRMKTLNANKAGWCRASQSTGIAVVGPWLGNYLTQNASFVVSYGVLSVMFAFMALYSQSFLPEAEPTAIAEQEGILGQLKAMVRDVWVAESCLTEFVNMSTVSIFSTFIILVVVQDLHASPEAAITLLTTQGLSTIVALFLFGYAFKKLPLSASYAGSLILGIAALVVLGTSHTIPFLMVGALLLSWAAALIHLVNVMRLAASKVSKSKIASLVYLSGLAGTLTGSVVGGFISKYVGLQNLYFCWIPVLVVAAVVCRVRATRKASLGEAGPA